MFGIIAQIASLFAAHLWPIFLSYKALKTPSTENLAPLITYFTTLSVLQLFETLFSPIISIIPLYPILRLVVHVYLLLPPPQGATFIYNNYILPFLVEHESDIEDMMTRAHEQARTLGLKQVKRLFEWIRVTVLGGEPHPPTPSPPAQSYAQQLIQRFYGTSASAPPATADPQYLSTLLSSLASAASRLATTPSGTGSKDGSKSGYSPATAGGPAPDLAASNTLIPPNLSTPEERMSYIRQARQGLQSVLQAFDREEGHLARDGAAITRNQSEVDFERVERPGSSSSSSAAPASAAGENMPRLQSQASSGAGGWMPWNWGASAKEAKAYGEAKKSDGPDEEGSGEAGKGQSTGVDLGY